MGLPDGHLLGDVALLPAGGAGGLQGLGRHDDRGRREQVRAAVRDVRCQPEQRRFGLEVLAQSFGVEAAAVAAAVERLCDRGRAAESGEAVRGVVHVRAHEALTRGGSFGESMGGLDRSHECHISLVTFQTF